jgi:multiple sugar transport system ATP-binding protein
MRAELKRLHATYGITTVYVTHDQEEAMALSDRIAVLDGGRVQQCDTPLRVYDDPHNLFVAGFIGSPPINVLAAVWRDGAAHPAPPGTAPESVIAIRPADIRVQAAADGPRLEAEVSLCEPTGSDLWVIGRWHGQPIVGRAAPGEAFTPGAKAHFAFAPERLYRFNRVSGARVRVER